MTAYVINGMLFHRYQAETPYRWRAAESWLHYCLSSGADALERGAFFDLCLRGVLCVLAGVVSSLAKGAYAVR